MSSANYIFFWFIKKKHLGAEEACLAHNQEDRGSKPLDAKWTVSSVAERPAVNRKVAGSIPARSVKKELI